MPRRLILKRNLYKPDHPPELAGASPASVRVMQEEKKQSDFESYAFQDLSMKQIKKFAKQYEGVNMAKLMGANEDMCPFVIEEVKDNCMTMWWNKNGGMMTLLDEDEVRAYATAVYLKKNAYPVFKNLKEAQDYAAARDWPLNVVVEPIEPDQNL